MLFFLVMHYQPGCILHVFFFWEIVLLLLSFCSAPLLESVEESNKFRGQNSNYSSSNSNSSSLSSVSSGSSGSDYNISSRGDLEADADSLICRQSGISSMDHLENDRLKMVDI